MRGINVTARLTNTYFPHPHDMAKVRPKARRLAQHGGPPGWLEECDPAGVILYVMDCMAVPSAFSVPYRLPWQELPSGKLMEFAAAV
jgi:hypothetical protein